MASECEFVPHLRLHALSWVFVLVASVRQFVVPIIVVLVFGGRDDGSLWGLVVVVPLVLAAVWRQVLYRYGFGPRGLVIRDGLLFRNVRQIEYGRIENIDTERGVLHRLMNVAEVRIETSAGGKPEALIRVLGLEAVSELRERVFGRAENATASVATRVEHSEVLLHLPPGELVRYGIVDNRGLLIIAAAFGAVSQWGDFSDIAQRWGLSPSNWAIVEKLLPRAAVDPDFTNISVALGAAALAAALLAMLVLFVRMLSVVWALVTLHDFTLVRLNDDLRMRYGLLTRIALTLRLPRIQAAHQTESVLHRWLGRVSLAVDLAGDGGEAARGETASSQRVRWLAPICTPERAESLLCVSLPAYAADPTPDWQPLAPKAHGRILRKTLVIMTLIAAGPSVYLLGFAAPLVWIVVGPLAFLHANLYVRHTRWGLTREALFVRTGWLTRRLSIVPRDRVQAARVSVSPFDRRAHMAALTVDTAGTGGFSGPIRIPYLPADVAIDILGELYRSPRDIGLMRGADMLTTL